MTRLGIYVLAGALAAALALPAAASVESVTVRDNAFDPRKTAATVGQGVVWTTAASTGELHNVREDRKIFYSGPADRVEFTFKRIFSAGTFHYFCERHGFRGGGMDGIVRVPVTLDAGPVGPEFTVRWATSASNTGTRYTVQYRLGAGSWRRWKANVRGRAATFQGTIGTKYTFRAKSVKGDAESKWSPAASITA